MGVFLLLAALLIQSFSRVLIVSDYFLNTASYAINCENKAKIEMHCNGQCQLMKKLEKENEKDAKNPQRQVQTQNEFFLWDQPFFTLTVYAPDAKQSFPRLADPKTMDRPHFVFRPPIA